MEKRKCVQCGREFVLTDSEIGFYRSGNFELPKRCAECREKNKADKNGGKNNGKGSRKRGGITGLIAVLLIAAVCLIYPAVNGGKQPAGSGSPQSFSESRKYTFRNRDLLEQHYEKHGREMGFDSAEEYEAAASAAASDPDALHRTEKEDGDDCCFIEETGEFVIISTDGYIRTYFIADLNYFNRQQRTLFYGFCNKRKIQAF